ncbi:ABC transporter permease [Virgibacillus oceani]
METMKEPSMEDVKMEPTWKSLFKKMLRNKSSLIGGAIIAFFMMVAILSPLLQMHDPTEVNLMERFQTPSATHWFGTDESGRDIFSRIIAGTHLTLYVGLAAVAIGAFIGTVLGLFAGFYGRVADSIIMRTCDVLLAFPGILLSLAIISALGPSLNNIIIALSIYNIPVFIRMVRGSVLEVKNMEFIDAIRVVGAKDSKIIFKHILGNVTSPIIVTITLRIANSILLASGLSFLGLGAQPPTPEWGAMLNAGQNYMLNYPHLTIFPGLMIVLVILGFNLLGDGLRDILDPKSK